jgi:hypothetical protein
VSSVDNTNQEVGFVDLSGVQTVRTIGAAHDRLGTEIARCRTVRLRLDDLGEFDLGLIQLVLAARRAALASGKSLTLTAPVTGALHTALDRGGFLAADAFWQQASGDQ